MEKFRYLLTIALMLFCIQMHAKSFSQSPKVSISVTNVTPQQFLTEIEKKTDLAFVYNSEELKSLGLISLEAKNEEVENILNRCFKNHDISYTIVNNHVVIRKEAAPQQKIRTITGRIFDKITGSVLPGATIRINGTNMGVAADEEGKFSIAVTVVNPVFVVSFIGYKSTEVQPGKGDVLEVGLMPTENEMETIVVTGIFERKADSYTGAVTTLKGEDLQKVGNTNVLQSLKNIDPSFQMIESNDFGSDPNRVPEIQMRGASSFSDMKDRYQTNPNQPLFIVDGFEQSITKVMDMDMNRIASITLLKDATAKALYGSKGANGVVVIETIAPAAGKLRVLYNGNVNIQWPDLHSYNLANAAEKLEIENRAGVYTAVSGNPLVQQSLDEQYSQLYNEVQRGVNTDWLSQPLRVGIGHKHSVGFEGGDDVIRYTLDFSYNKISGVMKGSDREVMTGGIGFQYRYRNFIFKDQLNVAFNKSNESPYGSFSEYAKLNPYWRTKNEDGSIREILGTYAVANSQGYHPIYNPLINADVNTLNASRYTEITNNFYAEWEAFAGMRFKGRFGIVSNESKNEVFYPRDHTSFRDIDVESDDYFNRGSYTMGNGRSFDYNVDISANYSKYIGKNLIFANAQWSFSESSSDMIYFQARGFANNKQDYITGAKEYASGSPYGSESKAREASALFSINYSYDDRYLFDATYRANASSLFGKDKRWGNFWSTGIGWNIHKEEFMSDATNINRLKLRMSTGYSGSQNFNTYQAISTYKYDNDSYDNIIGSTLMGLANPDLQWQKTQDNNIGIDISLWNSIDVTFDYYIKNTNNLLTPVSLPPSAGFTSYTENLGKTKNKGVEAKVNYRIIRNAEKQIYFSVFGSLMHNKNKITKISDALSRLNDERDKATIDNNGGNPDHETAKEKVTKPAVRYSEGQSMNAIWAVKSLGIDPMNGKEIFVKKDGSCTYSWDSRDYIVAGDNLPKVSGTFGFNAEYKGFSLNTSFSYRLGGQYYNQTLVDKVENADIQYNVDKRMYSDRWTTPGVAAKFKAYNNGQAFTQPTTRFVQDFNELQMTSLNLSYDFKNFKFIKTHTLEQLRVQLYMNDIFRASTVKTERGIEYPFARSFSFAIQATF